MKYHCPCFAALYNRERAHLLVAENQHKTRVSPEKEALPLVFSELLTYVTETRNNNNEPVAFRLAELVSLYKQRIKKCVTNIPLSPKASKTFEEYAVQDVFPKIQTDLLKYDWTVQYMTSTCFPV